VPALLVDRNRNSTSREISTEKLGCRKRSRAWHRSWTNYEPTGSYSGPEVLL
jgi:hypothetical protein